MVKISNDSSPTVLQGYAMYMQMRVHENGRAHTQTDLNIFYPPLFYVQ